jgi:NhaA family Na+:H+ antiporter
MDDIIAILVIAIFYAQQLSNIHIILSASTFGILILLNQLGITAKTPYILLGIVLWFFVLGSGIHTSIAGVLLAMTIPHRSKQYPHDLDPLTVIKEFLYPLVTFMILPLFAIVNTDVPVNEVTIKEIFSSLSLGISCGLFLGKQAGVFGSTYLLIKYGKAKVSLNTSWLQLYGISVLCGIGFTMSLFISDLAFEEAWPNLNQIAKVAIFIGSIFSACVGFTIVKVANKLAHNPINKDESK